jgi:acyl-CoA reductase-like NAD-dependent aldehyde dehydrogenase
MVSELRYGGIGVNSGSAADRDLPFGGFRQSGWGRENAFEGLSAYLETKSVVIRWGD